MEHKAETKQVVIYLDYISQPCRAVVAYCLINNIPFVPKELRIFRGETRTEEFKAISPLQKIPTIIHDDMTMTESHAIMMYLSNVFPVDERWYPLDPKIRALVDCYLHWHHSNLRHACTNYLFRKMVLPRMTGQQMSEEIEKELLLSQRKSFSFIENILRQELYVARTRWPTIADISCYCEVIQMRLVNFDHHKYPQVIRWMQEIGEIPGVKQATLPFFKVLERTKL